jgi:hypothetical protein
MMMDIQDTQPINTFHFNGKFKAGLCDVSQELIYHPVTYRDGVAVVNNKDGTFTAIDIKKGE